MSMSFSLKHDREAVKDHFGYANDHEFPPRDTVRPSEPVMIVRRGHRAWHEAYLVRWGLIPSWIRNFDPSRMQFTARLETILEKTSFRGGIEHKRCIVPASGFHVWKGAKGAKQRYLVQRRDGAPMGFAAIYEDWMGADGSEIDTMALISQSSTGSLVGTGALASLADRVPVLLDQANYADWLDCRDVTAGEAINLLRPIKQEIFEVV